MARNAALAALAIAFSSPAWAQATPAGPGAVPACIGSSLLEALGKRHVAVGAAMTDETAKAAPFDLRAFELSGGVPDSPQACGSCARSCSSSGQSCAGGGCGWWACWQSDADPPGDYLRRFLAAASADSQLPFITYRELADATGAQDGAAQIALMADPKVMERYFADWRFVLQTVGGSVAMLHVEPNLFAQAQQREADPHRIKVAVASANPTDCADQEDSFAGFGRCMVAMARKYAPHAKIGLHASPMATGTDVLQNREPSLDVRAEAAKAADFLRECGAADGDFIAISASDRDAGYLAKQGSDQWWDATGQDLPSFRQALTWAAALSERLNLPNVWWRLPVGNMSLSDTLTQWRDNRADYFFGHTAELAAAHSAAFTFGPGITGMTTPQTDDGNLVAKVRAYQASGGQPFCGP